MLNKKISVVIATYNGEKYIKEQLQSICNQTLKPNEIIVSDDGSKDATLAIVRKVSKQPEASGIQFVVLQDNPRHGYGGNFEWAMKHSSGDYIFLCDQDDFWLSSKVESVIEVFYKHPDAKLVFHDAELIDKDGKRISGTFNPLLDRLNIRNQELVKIGTSYCETACSASFINGMCMCISKDLMEVSIPFPYNKLHDQWLLFLATANDSAYFLNQILAQYRLHGKNVCGHRAFKGSLWDRIQKWKSTIKSGNIAFADKYHLASAMLQYLVENYSDNLTPELESASKTAARIVDIGSKTIECATSGRMSGAIRLIKLYCTDIRYRRSGRNIFLYQLADIILHSKKERERHLSREMGS